MQNKKTMKCMCLIMAAALTIGSVNAADIDSQAASKKAVKSVVLKINKTKVTKKTYTLKKGKTAKIAVSVTPASAKKSVSFKSSKKAVASVTAKGKVTAKKAGTAKITVTVTAKNKKKISTWVKIKVKKSVGVDVETTATTSPSSSPEATVAATASPKPTATASPEPTAFEPIDISTSESNPIGVTDSDGNSIYGGDPSVLVDGDTVYLYVGHDTSKTDSYSIPEYCVYSTKDLENWTYHGSVLSMKDVSWANKTAAWAGQVMKYNNKYYMYYCSWNSKDSGNQSIGVAVSDSPLGPFVDKGEALIKGSVTTDPTSNYNDIDPTAWIETDSEGVEHRYLAWGNGKFFVCELNEDMVSVKDINGDGKITFGTQASGKTSKDVDIIEKDMTGLSFTEAPWVYRRQDADGNYYGKYYLFYAYSWREKMAYTTTDDLLDGTWSGGNVVMEATATSNTNHMAVFDFKGETYFVYHNGSMPGGSGYRRIPCITKVNFEADGSITEIPESAAGVNGTTSKIYTSSGAVIAHEYFVNSTGDSEYPYTTVDIGLYAGSKETDTEWVITSGKADKTKSDYVSIQSENKPGLYFTANEDGTVTLAQDYDTKKIEQTAKKQTFIKTAGLSDSSMVSFESVSQPGKYITMVNGSLALTDGSDKKSATFSIDKQPTDSSLSAENDFAELKIDGETVDTTTGECNIERSIKIDEIVIEPTVSDKKGYFTTELTDKDGNASSSTKLVSGSEDLKKTVTLTGKDTYVKLTVYAENMKAVKTFMIHVSQDVSAFSIKDNVVKQYNFEDSTDGAIAVEKGASGAQLSTVENPTYTYAEGKNGKGIVLDGSSYGLKLANAKDLNLGESYTISFWMKPDTVGGAVDPTLTAGTFSPQYWLNLTFDAKIWSYKTGYVATDAASVYEKDEWQNVVISVNGDKAGSETDTVSASLYVNGKLVSGGNIVSGIMTTANSGIYFGVNAWDAYFKGTLDNVLIINRSLSAGEVSVLAAAEDETIADK